MDFQTLAPYGVGLVLAGSITLLLSHNWRVSIAALSVQYFGVFVLVAGTWPVEFAAVKLVAGLMSASILGATRTHPQSDESQNHNVWPTEWVFRLIAASLFVVAVVSLSNGVENFIPNISKMQVLGGMLLIGLGLLHLSLSQHALQNLFALLTSLSGFEIIYAVVESSTMVAGLLAAINLGIAFVGAYLLATHVVEDSI